MKLFASLAALVLMAFPLKSDARPLVGDLMAEKLYYAEGRQHPGHPLHGSHEGLWAGSER
ncbi:cyanate hydratase [Synechococcus sp. BIOS-E4-1]|nr:cyanate hydratase [Synechococcus sp. BIOS-E4-1]